MKPDQIEEYKKSVFARRAEGALITRAELSIGEWQPEFNMCHHNVTQLCVNEPSFTAIRGWLVLEAPDRTFLRFVAHSVVMNANGEVFDITPSKVSEEYPFIDGMLSYEEFASFVDDFGIYEFNYPPQKNT